MTELGALDTGLNNTATAINDAGQVVGTAWTAPYVPQYGFLWKDGVLTNLGVGEATDVNSSGQVLFTDRLWVPTTPNGTTGTFTNLPPLSDDNAGGRAWGIKNAGQAVGASYWVNEETSQGFDHGVLWEGGMPEDLEVLAGGPSAGGGPGVSVRRGVAINDAGAIVGPTGSGV